MVFFECITFSTISMKSKVQLLDKTGVPPCYNKNVKVVAGQLDFVDVRSKSCCKQSQSLNTSNCSTSVPVSHLRRFRVSVSLRCLELFFWFFAFIQ